MGLTDSDWKNLMNFNNFRPQHQFLQIHEELYDSNPKTNALKNRFLLTQKIDGQIDKFFEKNERKNNFGWPEILGDRSASPAQNHVILQKKIQHLDITEMYLPKTLNYSPVYKLVFEFVTSDEEKTKNFENSIGLVSNFLNGEDARLVAEGTNEFVYGPLLPDKILPEKVVSDIRKILSK